MAAIVAFAFSSNAQCWIGGSANFSTNGNKTKLSNQELKSVYCNWDISPKVGYQLNEKLAVGGLLSFGIAKEYPDKKNDKDDYSKLLSYSVGPFARYQFASVGDFAFKVVGEATFGQGFYKMDKALPIYNNDYNEVNLSLTIYPMITYSVSDKFELEANVNFFGLVASTTTRKYDNNDNKNVLSYIGAFGNSKGGGFGFVYKF